MAASKAPATLRAYRTDWTAFKGWCDRHGLQALPAGSGDQLCDVGARVAPDPGVLALRDSDPVIAGVKTALSADCRESGRLGGEGALSVDELVTAGLSNVFGSGSRRGRR